MIIIGGATASGKTEVAAMLAKKFDTSLVSADSMQIYKGLDIGTAKESDAKLGVKQYLIDIVEPNKTFTVVDYRFYAENAVKKIEKNGKIPIVVGGTGFYINSLIYSMDYGKSHDIGIKEELGLRLKEHGIEPLYQQLQTLDPISASKIHVNNERKVLRALEVTLATGKPFSEQNDAPVKLRDYKMFILLPKRELLYQRIEKRVDKMVENGLLDEVKALIKSGISFDMQSMQGIGYKEWRGYFDGTESFESSVELIKKNTRNYAKRQQTWFKNQYKDCIIMDNYTSAEEVVNYIGGIYGC